MSRPRAFLLVAPAVVWAALGCAERPTSAAVGPTCSGTYPSYWQDPAPAFQDMWTGQQVSNAPPVGWNGPVFRLSDAYPEAPVDDRPAQPWRDRRFDALFLPTTDQATKTRLASEYAWAVMRYIQEGNTGSGDVERDWTLCDNPVRPWYHMPFQTYDVLSGREFTHGLTREAPVSFNLRVPGDPSRDTTLASTMWAVGFYNATGAYTIGRVWSREGKATPPADNLTFDEGTVVGKLLFNTLSPEQLPMVQNLPAWHANVSQPSFCNCTVAKGRCDMAEQSRQCPRSTTAWGPVHLLQFDVAVKDGRAPGTQWVFGTFVADGQRKASEADPWMRISPLGLMWGNDPPPPGRLAHAYPADPRANGFPEGVIFWDVVDMLNAAGGRVVAKRPGHLGCNGRLNGPADNANSSCMSCHMTASVPDTAGHTPPILAQFQPPPGVTSECVTPSSSSPDTGTDAAGGSAKVKNGVSFTLADGVFFANTGAGVPVNMTVTLPSGPVNVLGDWPQYGDGRSAWISLDYSLQLSISLTQWGEWMQHQGSAGTKTTRVHDAILPAR